MLFTGDIVDPGQVERRGATPDRGVLVAQRLHTEPLQLTQPGERIVDEVLVVAGDEEGTLPGVQVPQRFCGRAEFLDRSVHDVADDRHEVRRRVVDHPDDPLGVGAPRERAEVDVRYHRDPKSVERRIELAQPHRYLQQVGRAQRGGGTDTHQTDRRRPRGNSTGPCDEHPPVQRRRRRGLLLVRRRRRLALCEALPREPDRFQHNQYQEQVDGETEPEVARPHIPARFGQPKEARSHQRRDKQHRECDQDRRENPSGASRPGRVLDQPLPEIQVYQPKDRAETNDEHATQYRRYCLAMGWPLPTVMRSLMLSLM